ncbi:Hsp70 protein that interacts with Zuo1p, partial [Coemansia sp. RSA 2322]
MAQKTFIGLSFGNHNSVIAIINKDQRAEVIANEEGEHKTPTYLAFSGDEEFHGSQAKHQIVRNAHSTVAGFRDMLGSGVTATAAGFAAVDAEGAFVVRTDGDRVIRVTAHEAAVRYVGRLRATAEAYVGRAIDGAVLAVPAWFTAAQRAAVGAACADAGLALLQV